MGRTIKVAAAQTGPVLGEDMAPGVEVACRMIEQAAQEGADIVCFSELFLTPFFPNQLRPDYEHFFLELPSPVTDPLLETARRHAIALIFPFGEKAGQYYYNSAAVFDRAGHHLGTYRKTHIPAILPSKLKGGTGSYEKFYFTPGDALPIFEMDAVRFGIQICYDRKFPEGSRVLALKGAEIIFMPICAATYGEKVLRADAWELPLQARAYESGVFVVAVNRAGDENGRRHIGKSMIVSPVGASVMAVAGADEPELLVQELDLDEVAAAQKSLPWWRDRRPDLYKPLVAGPSQDQEAKACRGRAAMKDSDREALIAGSAPCAFVDARLIDGLSDEPLERGFVRMREGRISEVGPMAEYRSAGGDERAVELTGQSLLPGLIDCHVHFVYSGFPTLEAIDRCPVEAAAINAVVNGGCMLDAGYTTVRDVGTIGNVAVAVREAIAAGKVRGPRVIASGQIIGPTSGMVDTLPSHWSKSGGLGVCVDGPEAIVKEVRRQIKAGVDNIKLGASGVEVGRYAYTWMTTLSAEEITAGVSEAHRWGRTVAIHCQSFDAAKFALRAGADTIEHGTRLDDEALALFAQSRTALVPTLSTLFSVLELGETLNLMPKQREEMAVNKEHWLSAVARAREANIAIGAGSDIGNRYPHGKNAREIEFLVRAGLTPMQAIKAATGMAARILGKEGSMGALTPGAFADLLVVDGDPLRDVRMLADPERIHLVLLEGRLVAGREIDRSSRARLPAPFPITLWQPREPAPR